MNTKLSIKALLFSVLALCLFTAVQAQEPIGSKSDSSKPAIQHQLYLPLTSAASSSVSATDFNLLSEELIRLESLFTGGNGELLVFDSTTARQSGFSEESILLAEELTGFTNDLIQASQAQLKVGTASINTLDVNVDQYPKLSAYFTTASKLSADPEKGVEASGWCNSSLTDAACSCGHWWYPRPSGAAPWREFSSSNPASTLRSWGYHETPGWAGGGWTRSQTYYPSRCGYNTFRDHAYIRDSTRFREQNYNGFTPRGEPNPEFWAGGPLPYGSWPSYVWWWHQNF